MDKAVIKECRFWFQIDPGPNPAPDTLEKLYWTPWDFKSHCLYIGDKQACLAGLMLNKWLTSIIKWYLFFSGNTFYDVIHLKSKPWNLSNLAVPYKVFSNKNTDWERKERDDGGLGQSVGSQDEKSKPIKEIF